MSKTIYYFTFTVLWIVAIIININYYQSGGNPSWTAYFVMMGAFALNHLGKFLNSLADMLDNKN